MNKKYFIVSIALLCMSFSFGDSYIFSFNETNYTVDKISDNYYLSNITFNNETLNGTYSLYLYVIPENVNESIELYDTSFDISTCNSFIVVPIKAILNEPRDFYISLKFNASKINATLQNDKITIFGNSSIPIKINCIDIGKFPITIQFTDSFGLYNVTKEFYVNVWDLKNPSITYVSHPSVVDVGENYTIFAYVFDEIGVKQVYLNNENNQFQKIKSFSNGLHEYSFTLNINEIGDSTQKIYVKDFGGNSEKYQFNVKALPKEYVSFSDVEVPQLRVGKKYYTTIMKSEEPVFLQVNFNYSFINYQNKTGEPVFFLYADDNVYALDKDKPFNVTAKDLKFGTYSDDFGQLNATIFFESNNQYILLNNKADIQIEFSNVTVLPDKKFIVSGREVICKLQEGNETDYYSCSTNFPVDIDLNDVGMVITKYDLELLQQLWQNKVDIIQGEKMAIKRSRTILILMLIFTAIGIFAVKMYKKIPPHMKWK